MGYLGNKPTDSYLTLEKQTFTTSATDTYTLDRAVSSVNDIELFLNNVRQEPTEAYTISGTTLTLASAITASDSMYCIYQGRSVGTQAPATGSVTNAMLAGSIANSKLANSSVTVNGTSIALGGSETISAGKVGQILSTTYGTSTAITSTSFTDTGMSANITPSATSSKIFVMFQCTAALSRANQEVGARFQLIRDSSVAFWTAAVQTYYQGAFGSVSQNEQAVTQIFSYLDSPNSTSSLNYKLQAAVNSGGGHTVTAQSGNTASVMTLMEILA